MTRKSVHPSFGRLIDVGMQNGATTSSALSGGSNLATALSLNACPYRAKSVIHRRLLS